MLTSASTAMIVTMVLFMVISGLSVVLRLYLRRRKKTTLKADDYLVIAAWVFSAALAITNIIGVPLGGFGVPFERFDAAQARRFLKILFILQFWYIIAVALVKLSILFLYGRVFGIHRFPTSVLILVGITICWLISFLFATFFQVWPLRCNWTACIPTTDYAVMYMLSSVTDIVIDVCILGLPAFFIRKLHLNGNQKIGLIGIFGLGIFCVVSSIARLAYTILFHRANIKGNYAVNFSPNVVNIIMWSGIEVCASTLCASLPCFGPLISHFHRIMPFTATISSFMPIETNKPSRTAPKGAPVHSPYASRESILGLETRTENAIEGSASRDASKGHEINVELGSIRVDNSVNINRG